MKKLVTSAVVLGTLSAGIFASPPPARAATADPAMAAACWNQVRERQHMPGYGSDAGADRKREYLFDACIQNGGRIP